MLEALQRHIQEVIDLSDLLSMTDVVWLKKAGIQKLRARLDKKQEEIDRFQKLLGSLYENLADGIIDQEEYRELKRTYSRRRTNAEEQADGLRAEMAQAMNNSDNGCAWMDHFRKHQGITELDRALVVTLIDRILLYRDHRVEIVYRWQNEFQYQMDLLQRAQRTLSQGEAV